jgi:hypothetical protein
VRARRLDPIDKQVEERRSDPETGLALLSLDDRHPE